MLAFLAAIAAIIQTLAPLIPTVAGIAETVKQLFDLGSQVVASGADPTHDQWAALVAMQNGALAQVHAASGGTETAAGSTGAEAGAAT